MYLTSLKDIPSINKIIQEVKGKVDLHEDYLKYIIKNLVNVIRGQIKKKDISLTKSELKAYLIKSVLKKTKHNLVNIINGTGIVLHTGFGRAPFDASSLRNIADTVEGYTNLEFDLNTGEYKQIKYFTLNTEGDPLNIDGENIGRTPIQAELINKGIKIFTKL